MLPQKITCRHLGSGAQREFEFVEFDAQHRVVLLRFGNAGVYDFCLRSGQGKDDACYWVIQELQQLRDRAAKHFNPGTPLPVVAPHRAERRQRKAPSLAPVAQRQLTLKQVRHG